MNAQSWAIDVALALAALCFACVQMYVASSPILFHDQTFRDMIGVINRDPGIGAYLMLAATTLPLIVRRAFPWIVFVFTFVVFVSSQGMGPSYSFSIIGPAIALFTIAYERQRSELIVAFALTVIGLFWFPPAGENDSLRIMVIVQNLTYLALASGAGVMARLYQRYLTESRERAAWAERTREEEAARRVEEERVRIAREIHDITAHSLSAVSIQAAAAERLLLTNPEAAREVIAEVRKTSKNSLEEIRSMIGVLRNENAAAETKPTNGTDRMGDLVEYAEQAGLSVQLLTDSFQPQSVPAYVDVALFGITREAVTNAVRHARATRLKITLKSDAHFAHLTVEDNGIGDAGHKLDTDQGVHGEVYSAQERSDYGTSQLERSQEKNNSKHDVPLSAFDLPSGGHGLRGMEERARVLQGEFFAGGRPQGGFMVEVHLPLQEGEHHG